MKKIGLPFSFLLFLMFLAPAFCMAETPHGMNYQAVVRNSAGNVMPNQHVNLRFTFRIDSLTGNIAYRETDTATATPQGIFTIIIGGGNIVNGTYGGLNWARTSYYLQVEMDVNGGTNFIDMGTSRLMTAPYAEYANKAGSVALAQNTFHNVTGNDTLTVGNASNVIIPSAVLPANALITLTPGDYNGQMLLLQGQASGSNGVRIESAGVVNVGSSGGPVDLTNGATLLLVWTGTEWRKVSYSSNQ